MSFPSLHSIKGRYIASRAFRVYRVSGILKKEIRNYYNINWGVGLKDLASLACWWPGCSD